MDAATAKHAGARTLGEIEEDSLEELLDHLRTTSLPRSQGHPPLNPQIPIASLSSLISKHHHANQSAPPPLLALSGRPLPLLYHLTSTLIARPCQYSVVIVDVENRFEITRLIAADSSDRLHDCLPAEPEDLEHVYIYRPARASSRLTSGMPLDDPTQRQIQACLDAAQKHMLYSEHASRERVWWGTIVIGGGGGDVNTGWKGWMDVQRRDAGPSALETNAEEALTQRERRYTKIKERGWEGRSRVGLYSWGGGG
ncbi:hypothetical protein SCAR479_11129 [Seiridium cardinale]|uniref:Uncharacterized protein n=1 Tax=Seiridium cardinale TaxID=138064 RepID=A0ABR2XEL5_9PEZI